MISVNINGKSRLLEKGYRLDHLLEELGFAGARIAVELNESVVPASCHVETYLSEGDQIEIVHAIGGG